MYTDEAQNLGCVTIATRASPEAFNNAKAAVQEAYRKEGFDMPAMLERLQITVNRGVYELLQD